MRIKSFFELVEIRTKIASQVPLFLGSLYAVYHFGLFKPLNFLLMFLALLLIDMTTTACNHYYDYKKAIRKHGFNYERHNPMIADNLKESSVLLLMGTLFLVGSSLGILLFLQTDAIVLLLGMLSFGVGLLYSFGPVPISRTPFGEIISGFFMGFVIVFLSVYIHIYDIHPVLLSLHHFALVLQVNLAEVLPIFFVSLVTQCGIANIMLANNLCDQEDDFENKRYTLPHYIGKERALKVYSSLYYIAFLNIFVLSLSGILPWICMLACLGILPVQKNIKIFLKKQSKKETFVLSIQNFMLLTLPLLILYGISYLVKYFL